MKKAILALILLAVAFAASLDDAHAQAPAPTATPAPTPTPAPLTTRRNLTVSVSEDVVGFVYPNGVAMFIVRFLVSPGDDQVTNRFPPAASVVTFALTPSATSFAAGNDVIIRPAIVPGSTGAGARGWGRGLGIGVCQCFRGLHSTEHRAELRDEWTLTTELNPEYVTNPSSVQRDVKLDSFLEMDEYAPAESAVRAAIADVNRDQPAALLDGRFLSQAGEVYLASYALDLHVLLPDLYSYTGKPVALATPEAFRAVELPVVGFDEDDSMDNVIEMGVEAVMNFTGLRTTESTGLAWGAFAVGLTIMAGIYTRHAVFPVCVLVFVLLAGVTFGWVPVWVAVVIVTMAAIALGWMFWLKKGVGA